jgi:hypothetical protein
VKRAQNRASRGRNNRPKGGNSAVRMGRTASCGPVALGNKDRLPTGVEAKPNCGDTSRSADLV